MQNEDSSLIVDPHGLTLLMRASLVHHVLGQKPEKHRQSCELLPDWGLLHRHQSWDGTIVCLSMVFAGTKSSRAGCCMIGWLIQDRPHYRHCGGGLCSVPGQKYLVPCYPILSCHMLSQNLLDSRLGLRTLATLNDLRILPAPTNALATIAWQILDDQSWPGSLCSGIDVLRMHLSAIQAHESYGLILRYQGWRAMLGS